MIIPLKRMEEEFKSSKDLKKINKERAPSPRGSSKR